MLAKIEKESNDDNPEKKEEKQQKNNTIQQNINENMTEDVISNIIKEIPLNNLNDYYDIETNLFKKRIEKLNLKFYWTYESILSEENNNTLLYPYNKLFLILFKEISLYIEEILRLNKQLNSKNKNEKYYIQKLNDFKTKEKEFLSSKQINKNLQKKIKILEKNNEKLKNEIMKLNKKVNNSNVASLSPSGNSILGIWRNAKSSKKSYNNNITTASNAYYFTEQGSVMSSGSNILSTRTYLNNNSSNKSKNLSSKFKNNRIKSNSSINTKTTNISSAINNNNNKNNNNDIISLGINQCEEEINNLNMIENLLIKYYDNNYNKKILFKGKSPKNYKIFSQEKSNRSQVNYTTYKRNANNFKQKQKSNKSIGHKTSSNIFKPNKI